MKIKNCYGKKELVILQERKRGEGKCNLPITHHDCGSDWSQPVKLYGLLTETRELDALIEEDFARYLPWSEKVQEKCNIGSVCTEKINTTSKKQA